MMEENIKFTLLYDIYGTLLTKKQQDLFEEYYLFNLSLREIALNKNISYQAVRDSIKKSEELLLYYENKIGVYNLKSKVLKIKNICEEKNTKNAIEKNKILSILSEDDI